MSSVDLSRHATNFAKHYAGSRLGQGQVLSDDDFNDASRILHEDMRRTRVDVIGPAGTPDAGFKITNPAIVAGRCSFTIKTGAFYLGGLRLTLEADEVFHLQRDWLQQPAAARPLPPGLGETRFDTVVMEALQQPVSGTEDSELMEPAFGGAPPAARIRSMRRVFVEADVGSSDCKAAWALVQGRWAGLGAIGTDAELKPDARLKVVYGNAGVPADLCSPGVAAGFLGAENQAIRVQCLPGNRIVWGYDNASKIYRVEVLNIGGARRKLHFLTTPRDAQSRPLAGQVVEILPWSAVLANRVRADGSLDRCDKVAELTGHLAVVESSFNPSDHTLTLLPADAVPAGYGEAWKTRSDQADLHGAGPDYYFVRVWDRGQDAVAAPKSLPFVVNTPLALGDTGLLVTLTGTQFPEGLHWIIAARPETADQVMPWQFDSGAGRMPHGTRRFRAPLAVIRWRNVGGVITGDVVDDCRDFFLPLTRIRSCCTVTVGDGISSQGHFSKINDAIAALPAAGGEVCVLAGHYVENVSLLGKTNIAIHGCGPDTVVESPVNADGEGLGPVFDITQATGIRIERLAIVAHGAQAGVSAQGGGGLPHDVHLDELAIEAGPRSAIELIGGTEIVIRSSTISMRNEPGPWAAVYSGASDVVIERNLILANPPRPGFDTPSTRARGGIQLGGGSERVRIIDNVIRKGIGNGITLGSLVLINPPAGQEGWIIFWVVDPGDFCDPCHPGDILIIEVPPGGAAAPVYRSAGSLYDILIERNRIFDTGLNGIGVVGFFNLVTNFQLIMVEGLRIIGNEITRCLGRELALTPAAMRPFMGYGAIALAACTRLLIRENTLVGNGIRDIDPVCGIFLLFGQGVEIDANRIEENGAKGAEPSASARPGIRSGIHVGFAIPAFTNLASPAELKRFAATSSIAERFFRIEGTNALSVRGNAVTQPLGRSLTALALGHVAVADNTLTSRGIPPNDISHIIAANVFVVGAGCSNELEIEPYVQLLVASISFVLGGGPAPSFDPASRKVMCEAFSQEPEPHGFPGYLIPSSKVMFIDNRCGLDLMGEDPGIFLSSILVIGSDDIAFGSNQCETDMPLHRAIAQALIGAMSVRVHDNRFAETRRRVVLSAISGGLLNTLTNNQSTHCVRLFGPSFDTMVDTGNVALHELFCGKVCH